MSQQRPFKMTISLDVLHHLGIGLYSNIPAVLSELVANAWDADATQVDIILDHHDTPSIEIRDDGHGMSLDDINDKFLTVGYQRRKAHPETPDGRAVMGRKGIGKLAAFSIADTVEVHTSNGEVNNAFRMNTERIEESARNPDEESYFPDPMSCVVRPSTSGTLIRLTDLRTRLSWTAPNLRRRLARRFSVIGGAHGFRVLVDGEPITVEDRDYFKDMEFIWHFGERAENWDFTRAPSGTDAGTVRNLVTIDPDNGGPPIQHRIRGFVGTVKKPSQLDDVNNAIVLSARGRLVHEDMLPEYRQARVYTEYVVGEVVADFLDDTDTDDIVTSGRQRVQQDDARYLAVKKTVNAALRSIRDDWDRRRKKAGLQRALEYPSVKQWYERMGPDKQKTAKRLFEKIEALRLAEAEPKYELYRASMLAFEKLALRDMLSALDGWETHRDFTLLARLMSGVDEIEETSYHEIVTGRLKVIDAFRKLVPDAMERTLQKYIFDRLWLLHPSWDRATSNAHMERTVRAEFDRVPLTEEERRGRIDIRYRTTAGKHIIIELKKRDASVNVFDLAKQLTKYKNALAKCLRNRFPDEVPFIECIAVLGKQPTGSDDRGSVDQTLGAIHARYLTYDQLISEAQKRYSQYLEARDKASELSVIMANMRADFGLSPTHSDAS